MAIDIRTPNINAPTESGRLEQIRSYLYQISEQLNWAFSTVETNISTSTQQSVQTGAKTSTPEEEALSNFNSLKALIIKSADIVNAYSEEIKKKLEGLYVASGDFGSYKEEVTQIITENEKGIRRDFYNKQEIDLNLDGLRDEFIESNAYIHQGLLEYDATTGKAVYGLEIGQEDTKNGEKIFYKFARFTADRLSFYDSNDYEVAYISDYKLFIETAEIKGLLTHGGYDIDSSDGIAYLWKGRV